MWVEESNMQFNAEKFQTPQCQSINRLPLKYGEPVGIAIPEVESMHDLGIHMNSELLFHVHIAKMSTMSRQLTC